MTSRIASIGLLVIGFGMGASAAVSAQNVGAECHTYDERSEPSSTFRVGDPIVIGGTGFDAEALVLIDLEQGKRETELARIVANDIGAFTTTATVPDSAAVGKAVVQALDARGSARCPITLLGAGSRDESHLGKVYLVWGAGLAVFAALLGLISYRGWKSERLQEAVERLGWRSTSELAQPGEDEAESDDQEVDGDGDEHAEWMPPERAYLEEQSDPPEPEPIVVDPVAAPANDPEALPPGWSQGKSLRESSPAVARLQREVRNWRK
jgi:hypothetical protein